MWKLRSSVENKTNETSKTDPPQQISPSLFLVSQIIKNWNKNMECVNWKLNQIIDENVLRKCLKNHESVKFAKITAKKS